MTVFIAVLVIALFALTVVYVRLGSRYNIKKCAAPGRGGERG